MQLIEIGIKSNKQNYNTLHTSTQWNQWKGGELFHLTSYFNIRDFKPQRKLRHIVHQSSARFNDANLWDRIPQEWLLGYVSTSPWGRCGAIASQCPTTRTPSCFHSFLVRWSSFRTWSGTRDREDHRESKLLHPPQLSWPGRPYQ